MTVEDRERRAAFKARVRHWARKLDVRVHWLGVRPMSSKWASCSANSHLNFNADLLGYDEAVWDYVIVHELLHFFVPNHGRLWKSLMRAHLGDYEAAAQKLAMSPVGVARSTIPAGDRLGTASSTGPLRRRAALSARVQGEKVEP